MQRKIATEFKAPPRVLVALLISVLYCQEEHKKVYLTLSELPVDENGRLSTHMLLTPAGCTTMNVPATIDERTVGVADGELADALKLTDMCPSAIALEVRVSERPKMPFVPGRGGGVKSSFIPLCS
jgi:hypothetical protein